MVFERKINYYETDRMGIVHHSNYIRYFEEARCYALEKIGLPYGKIEELGIMIPVLEVEAVYKTPVTFDDVILVDTTFTEVKGARMTVEYTITNKQTGNIVVTGKTMHCFTDSNLKPIILQKKHEDVYNKFMKCIIHQ